MARKKSEASTTTPDSDETISLAAQLSTDPTFKRFAVWLIGDTPLICHAWSEKAKHAMLAKQVKAAKGGREARDPQADFLGSLYQLGENEYGFPITAVKNAILSVAHKDKGLPRATLQSSLWLDADMVRVRPALQGAICDMPLVRIYGSAPEMREDMVRVGAGLNKTSSLAYRAQFTNWGLRVSGKINGATVSVPQLVSVIRDAGLSCGVGDWRNEKKGVFGAFHMADVAESALWDKFAAGKGPLPISAAYREAA